ncbi:hypothetical protein M0R89_03045 [Halorussus limi]|uniref:Twin-arginine translocation signal domain-containing protein n=1 Tax=Halorussus limi TaxID=2938695 RepID=A0A8U0HVD7_9EURY|nr:hypothetical protein [Halorussus limi]UPV75052.1 hypothetical protein M0R89_03045 [Halorussus limi]
MTNRPSGGEPTPEQGGESTSERDGQPTPERDGDRRTASAGSLDRRTLLKGTAAAGLAGAGVAGIAGATGWREITFCAAGEETFSYEVSVSGRVKRGGTYETDDWDELVDGNTGRGAVSDGRCDSWLFTGDPTDLQLDGPGKVFVDGELFEDTTGDEPKLPNTVTIRARGETVEYKFRVSGRVEKGDLADESDDIDGNAVRGAVGGEARDDFRYSGSLAFDRADGPLEVTLHLGGD